MSGFGRDAASGGRSSAALPLRPTRARLEGISRRVLWRRKSMFAFVHATRGHVGEGSPLTDPEAAARMGALSLPADAAAPGARARASAALAAVVWPSSRGRGRGRGDKDAEGGGDESLKTQTISTASTLEKRRPSGGMTVSFVMQSRTTTRKGQAHSPFLCSSFFPAGSFSQGIPAGSLQPPTHAARRSTDGTDAAKRRRRTI